MSEFDVNGYNSHECDIHNHGYYLGAQSQQTKIDELQEQLRTALAWLNSSSSKSDSAVKHAIDCLKGNKDEHN